jgi:hypothetical protein
MAVVGRESLLSSDPHSFTTRTTTTIMVQFHTLTLQIHTKDDYTAIVSSYNCALIVQPYDPFDLRHSKIAVALG